MLDELTDRHGRLLFPLIPDTQVDGNSRPKLVISARPLDTGECGSSFNREIKAKNAETIYLVCGDSGSDGLRAANGVFSKVCTK